MTTAQITPMTATSGPRLRDMSSEEFEERYSCDRFTASVLANRMRYTVQHMCTGLLNNAFSVILRDWYDFASTVTGPPEQNYSLPAVSNSLAHFLGPMSDAVRNVIVEFGPENLRPGDVVICNDPYRVGTHVNDVCFIRPVFAGDQIVSFVTLKAHQLDMGGVVPAGFSGTKRNVYESGLVISPRLLYRDNKPLSPSFQMIFDNARFCSLLLPDIKTIYQNLLLGERLLVESVERYGRDAYLGALRYACDVSAEAMDRGLEALPDGVYEGEDQIDADGIDDSFEYRIKLKITKARGRLEVDLNGSSQQARSSVNCGTLDTKTAIVIALKSLFDPNTPFTSGSFRPIDIVLPAGTCASAVPPDGPIFLYWEGSIPVFSAVLRALRAALGLRAVGGDLGSMSLHNANGAHEDGTPWVTMAQCGGEHGPAGANMHSDGDSYTVGYLANNLDPATEAIEADVPVVLLRKEYVIDTGGPGINRGGAAVVKDSMWLSDAEQYAMPLHTKTPSGVGVSGGKDGGRGAVWVFPPEAVDMTESGKPVGMEPEVYEMSLPLAGVLNPKSKVIDPVNGEYAYFASTPIWHTQPGTVFRFATGGGGGWGDPLERDPQRVLTDVRDEYVSIEGALGDYGVVVEGDPQRNPEGLVVDEAATQAERASRRSAASNGKSA